MDTDNSIRGRGMLTPEIQERAVALFGREIALHELRLIPYLHSCMVNSRCIEPKHVNAEERGFLSEWRKLGFIEGGASDNSLFASRPFWDFMSDVLWYAYSRYDD